ncbi:hypothetical protein B0H67DRAFT_376987 [Lasiosphaeris hirsuta]|uniref:Uncharacterized protein n=1 Tax=Lasiosphaeris hirsuta TaxID=260670 RepID=A0AA39ZX29_9PEZI|nr:hypothetical protein B0H67DRAFT_376987 [Lasiosphaeris hirsuta]
MNEYWVVGPSTCLSKTINHKWESSFKKSFHLFCFGKWQRRNWGRARAILSRRASQSGDLSAPSPARAMPLLGHDKSTLASSQGGAIYDYGKLSYWKHKRKHASPKISACKQRGRCTPNLLCGQSGLGMCSCDLFTVKFSETKLAYPRYPPQTTTEKEGMTIRKCQKNSSSKMAKRMPLVTTGIEPDVGVEPTTLRCLAV